MKQQLIFQEEISKSSDQQSSVYPFLVGLLSYYYSDHYENNKTAVQSSIINITQSVASIFAPADRSSCTPSAYPSLAAIMRGVSCKVENR